MHRDKYVNIKNDERVPKIVEPNDATAVEMVTKAITINQQDDTKGKKLCGTKNVIESDYS